MRPWIRRNIVVLIGVAALVLLGLVGVAFAHGDPVLSHDDAAKLIQQNGIDWAADRIVALDYILKTTPTLQRPQLVKAIQGDALYLAWQPAYIEVTVPPRLPNLPPPIDYKVPMPEDVSKHFIPPPDYTWAWILGSAASALALTGGLLLGHALK